MRVLPITHQNLTWIAARKNGPFESTFSAPHNARVYALAAKILPMALADCSEIYISVIMTWGRGFTEAKDST